jgi:hypothetical protein
MVGTSSELFCIGDLVRMERAKDCLGMIVGLTDAWTQGKIHHVRVFWFGGDLSEPIAATWVPVKELEIISKMREETVDK